MVKVRVIFFMVVILAVSVCGNVLLTKPDRANIRDVRIVGGEDTNITQFSHQASLQILEYNFCGASLISNRWLITAAHCTRDFSSNQTSLLALTVRLGTTLWRKGGQVFSVARVISHPLYAAAPDRDEPGYTLHYDISLLYLSQEVTFGPTIQPIRLAEASEVLLPGTICTTTGWGRRSETVPCLPNILQAVNVPLVTNEICGSMITQSQNGSYTKIPADMLCAGFPYGGRDTCSGDSGGPLIAHGSLIGVTSWGYGCGQVYSPGVYTRVQYFREWIRDVSGV